ncbi:DUF1428 domain-containing protein (plasmid) [Paracoccus sp. TK19116]|uniref:DUF1428 domain-containing protein n=1 Tax=Paracoccus albicereus TaxID=2922394 RepID=A0ABT1MNE8_9RHOB|nr:DUF1428 domain-containing protein [Paracoccus albicereus]MCQ0968973.1 DUF1428 domain-containing protein [Paracoccus albicereus]
MTFYWGFVQPVPKNNKQAYIDHAAMAWPIFEKLGAVRAVECWAEDVPKGKQTDFYRAVQCKDDEVPVFSWIEWPDKATAETAGSQMQNHPDFQAMPPMPFDGMRMFWGGFSPIVSFGQSKPGSYVQGFVLAVPEDNKDAYVEMARSTEGMFTGKGATHMVEGWGDDVPHGKVTDFYRAADAKDGEIPMFSWVEWPDRATCDKAAREMETEMSGQDMPAMPFDGKRMFWGGFEPIFDSASQ